MRRFDPDGEPWPPAAYVFGDAAGRQVTWVKGRTPWREAVLAAHGITVEYRKGTHLFTDRCQDAFQRINLHFHDLRRECGSRWLEGGVPIQVVRDWLGHTNVAQTSTYLAGTAGTQTDAMRRFEEHQQRLQEMAGQGQNRHRGGPRSAAQASKRRRGKPR